MKKIIYLVLFTQLVFLGGCNLFQALDKKEMDTQTFAFELDDKMASGNYAEVATLVTDKINNTPALVSIKTTIATEMAKTDTVPDWATATTTEIETYYNAITTYLNDNISDPNVKEYIDLKLTLAEAELGISGLKMTDIIAKLTEANGSNANKVNSSIQKNVNSDLKISDIIPKGLNSESLTNAVNAYIAGLPSSLDAYNILKDDYSINYLNASLSSAISAVNKVIVIFAVDKDADTIVLKDWSAVTPQNKIDWADDVNTVKLELTVAIKQLTLFGSSSDLIKPEDLTKIKTNMNDVFDKIKAFDNKADYDAFKDAVGL